MSLYTGNFRFTTSIESDALTLSFHSTYPPSTDFADTDSIPSPVYSPIYWDELSVDLEDSAPSDTSGLQPATQFQSRPGSQTSVGNFATGSVADDLGGGNSRREDKSLLLSGWVQWLTESMPFHPTQHLETDDESLPNVHLSSNGTYVLDLNSDTLPNVDWFTNASSALGHAIPTMPNGLAISNASSALGYANPTMLNGLTISNISSTLGHDVSTMPNDAQ